MLSSTMLTHFTSDTTDTARLYPSAVRELIHLQHRLCHNSATIVTRRPTILHMGQFPLHNAIINLLVIITIHCDKGLTQTIEILCNKLDEGTADSWLKLWQFWHIPCRY